MGKIIKVFTVLVSLVLIIAAMGVAMLAFPLFGNQALIVRSGSMEPDIGVGSVVVVREVADAVYNVGDVISFRYDANTIITHRITEVFSNATGIAYKTKGDANEEEDNWTVAASDVIGKNYLTIPEFGKALAFARTKYGFPLLIVFPAGLVILFELISIIREIIKSGRKKREQRLSNTFNTNLGGIDNTYRISADSYFTKHNFNALKVVIPFIAFGFFIQSTSAFFSDTETSTGNFFQAAETFPTPTGTITPTPTPKGGNLCDDIDVNISGNGAGSVNGVFIICKKFKVIYQNNSSTVNTEINTNSNTGNNSSNGNTSTTTTTTGNTTTTTSVTVTGGTNSNNSPTPTP